MRVIKPSRIRQYIKQYPDAATSLTAWLGAAKRADWSNLIDVRRSYPHADKAVMQSNAVVTVFNICGNKYRLVVALHFNRQVVYVLRFMTHADYSKNNWKRQL